MPHESCRHRCRSRWHLLACSRGPAAPSPYPLATSGLVVPVVRAARVRPSPSSHWETQVRTAAGCQMRCNRSSVQPFRAPVTDGSARLAYFADRRCTISTPLRSQRCFTTSRSSWRSQRRRCLPSWPHTRPPRTSRGPSAPAAPRCSLPRSEGLTHWARQGSGGGCTGRPAGLLLTLAAWARSLPWTACHVSCCLLALHLHAALSC